MTQQPMAIVGMSWYRKEDYKAIQRIMVDPHTLFDTYEEWLASAEKGEKSMRLQGCIVVRAYIDPLTFPDWCASNGHKVDAKARMAFANTVAAQEARKSQH